MPLSRGSRTLAPVLALAIAAALPALAHAAGAGPFGVGLPEPAPTGGGLFPALFRAIAGWQASFYLDLTATVKAVRSDGRAGFWLAGLSFLYGILHALGPGHGKTVISTYVLANRETARNGAILALVSALLQAVTAVLLVTVAAVIIGATSIAMTRAALWLEAASFVLVSGLGAWLVWRKVVQPLAAAWQERFAPVALSAAPIGGGGVADLAFSGGSATRAWQPRLNGLAGAHIHGPDCGCGHAHLPAPEMIAGPLDWRKASSALLAVGFRPCTGALIVLVFALSQGVYLAGILSAVAMAVGTGITVAGLAVAAVSARAAATRLAATTGGGAMALAHRLFEGGAAIAVLAFGLTMLGASLYG